MFVLAVDTSVLVTMFELFVETEDVLSCVELDDVLTELDSLIVLPLLILVTILVALVGVVLAAVLVVGELFSDLACATLIAPSHPFRCTGLLLDPLCR